MNTSNIIKTVMRQSWMVAVTAMIMGIASWTYDMGTAEAIPAFARKYEVSCNVCHTRQPRLNTFGQRFLENGYQLPGTSDGGITKKSLWGSPIDGATIDDNISNFFAVRLRADIQQANYRVPADTESSQDLDIVFPNVVNMFFGGTATRNISYLFEAEYATREGHTPALAFERTQLVFSNLGGDNVANVKVGAFDPSSFYSFPTHRQQLNPIGPEAHTDEYPPTINRVPLLPLAFASKMFGLTTGPDGLSGATVMANPNFYDGADSGNALADGFAILPFQPYLYNAPVQTGVSVHGRPFGNDLLYQAGFVTASTAEDEAKQRIDIYAMLRYDVPMGDYSALSVSGFFYNAPKAARPTLAMDMWDSGLGIAGQDGVNEILFADNAVNWNRIGFGARWQHKAWDIYGTYIVDTIDTPVFSAMGSTSTWQTTGTGISIEADYLLNSRWLIGTRLDLMDPGGLKRGTPGFTTDVNQDAAFLGLIGKYYPRPNIALYGRAHYNLLSSAQLPNVGIIDGFDGQEHPARNLTYMVTVGVDMAF